LEIPGSEILVGAEDAPEIEEEGAEGEDDEGLREMLGELVVGRGELCFLLFHGGRIEERKETAQEWHEEGEGLSKADLAKEQNAKEGIKQWP
jgi:hypothetical protein